MSSRSVGGRCGALVQAGLFVVFAGGPAWAQGSQNPYWMRKQQGNAPISAHVSIAACNTPTTIIQPAASASSTDTTRSIMVQCIGAQDCYVSTTNTPAADGLLLSHTSLMAVWLDSSARTAIYACGNGGTSTIAYVSER